MELLMAHLIFCESLLAVNASLARCIASKLLLKIFLASWHVRASPWSLVADVNLGFLH